MDARIDATVRSSSVDSNFNLASWIAAVHVVYHFSKSEILWFGQLAAQMPGILEPLLKKVQTDGEETVQRKYIILLFTYCTSTVQL